MPSINTLESIRMQIDEAIVYLFLIAMMFLVNCRVKHSLSFSLKALALALFAAYSALLMFMVYMVWPMDSDYIIGGIQGRYFIPIFPALLLVFSKNELPFFMAGKYSAIGANMQNILGPLLVLWTVFGLSISAITIMLRYYV